MILRRALALLALVGTLTPLAPARAEPATGGGSLSPTGRLTVSLSDTTPGRGADTPIVGVITYKVETDNHQVPGDMSGLCGIDPLHGKFGWTYRFIGTTVDGAVVIDEVVCVPFDNSPKPKPPAPPQLPTLEETWNAANLPTPAIVTDPPNRGITNLPTRIAATSPTTLTVSATIRGYRIVGTATLDHVLISVDGGPATRAANDSYTFATKGNHTITIAAVWHGRATLTGPGLNGPIALADIGTATLTAQRDYPVHELRSVLQPEIG